MRVQSWYSRGGVGWGGVHRTGCLRRLMICDMWPRSSKASSCRRQGAPTSVPRQIYVRSAALARVGLAECRSSGELPYY